MAIKIQGGNNPLVQCINPYTDKWMILWNQKEAGDTTSYLAEVFDHKPSMEEVKSVILDWYNAQIDQRILSDFSWRGISVWLSMENQFNYKAAYDLAVQSEGQILPKFKFGTSDEPVYYQFNTLEDLKDFYVSALSYVTRVLSEGWEQKDNINWGAYEDLLK